ncbi:MAG: ankyrin repeat-containing protein [Acidobacteria bacterium OLB17]|nr:MAG: ankyrin repeat-containing protein [Acidobacteria bacterium OLB17]MCZ2389793.1 tetratricopeptide repeat protein [Acidobacteriota bacterium]
MRLKQNRNNEALAAFDKALQLDPQNASAAYYRGQAYSRMDEPANMIASYKQALNLEPNYSPAAFDLGVAYYNAGDYANAAASYETAVKADPQNAQAHANLASTYRQLERYDEANAQYALASEKIKTDTLYSEWGYCLGKVNAWDKASERLLTARDLSPVAVNDSNISWAYYNQAISQSKTSPAAAKANFELSRAFATKAVQQDPKLDAAYLNLGSTENKLGNYSAAVNALKSALNLRSDWLVAMNQLGVGYRGMNNLTEAIAVFKRATDLDGNYVAGLFNLGEAYNASGDKKAARRIQDRLGKLDASLANVLGDVFKGKISIDGVTRGLGNEVPKVPKIPKIKLPY